tara:strand:+ start:41078 stop:42043 length:966 start_codon:yes stop_codon:yes gene_type:complete
MKTNTSITVLGAGVSGLTTGIVLAENGYDVQIITKDLPHETTSAVAAAIWFPYEAYPEDKVSRWSSESFQVFEQLAKISESGVSFILFTAYLDTFEKPWWLEALPESHLLNDWEKSPVNEHHRGYKMNVPLMETPIYLKYLLRRFLIAGGDVSQKEINRLAELNSDQLIINCTGLGARYLFDDKHVFPIQGQVLKVEPDADISGISTEYPMGEHGDEMAYIIPRRDCIVLGGSARKHEFTMTPDEELTERIIKYCASFQPKIEGLNVLETTVGLRPGRSEIRVEKDPHLPVIHNYGHGGAGYTVSWGCAHEVLNILQNDLG